jgi:hypothetical protein
MRQHSSHRGSLQVFDDLDGDAVNPRSLLSFVLFIGLLGSILVDTFEFDVGWLDGFRVDEGDQLY